MKRFAICLFAVFFAVAVLPIMAADPSEKELAKYMQSNTCRIVTDRGSGSGNFAADPQYVLTANHVIAGAKKITVITLVFDAKRREAREEKYDAEVISYDEESDISVLWLKGEGISKTAARFYAAPDPPDLFDLVYQSACPGGARGAQTIMRGYISFVGRRVPTYTKGTHTLHQVAIPSYYGASGAGFWNPKGEYIGMAIQTVHPAVTHCFFIPVQTMREHFEIRGLTFLMDPSVKAPTGQALEDLKKSLASLPKDEPVDDDPMDDDCPADDDPDSEYDSETMWELFQWFLSPYSVW